MNSKLEESSSTYGLNDLNPILALGQEEDTFGHDKEDKQIKIKLLYP